MDDDVKDGNDFPTLYSCGTMARRCNMGSHCVAKPTSLASSGVTMGKAMAPISTEGCEAHLVNKSKHPGDGIMAVAEDGDDADCKDAAIFSYP